MARAVILAAHGSESSRGRTALARFLNAVRRAARGADVQDAFIDVEEPTVHDVVGQVAGPRTVVPLLLHAEDPLHTLSAVGADPFVTVTQPLGPDWALAEVGVRRLIEAGARSEDSILLAAGPVTDQAAVEDVGRAALLLSAVWGGRVHVGTLAGPDTPLGDAVDIARAYGKRVVVASYVLTEGRTHDQFAAVGADLVTAPLLNADTPDQRLVDLVMDRVHAPASRAAEV